MKKIETCPLNCDIKTLWHGTTLGRAKNILEEGFKPITLMEGEQAGEGYSSSHYEGGLYFFGKDNLKGKTLASRHAQRTARQFSDSPALLELKTCICNELTDDMINDEFNENLRKKALQDQKEKKNLISEERGGMSVGHRFTYSKNWGDRAFDSLSTGVMTDYGIRIDHIIDWLGYDAIDGFEEDRDYYLKYKKHKAITTVLNHPEKVIMDIKLHKLKTDPEMEIGD